jgi:hypothetical protein
MSFSEMTSDDGTTFLQASAMLDGISNADLNKHTDLAYIKMEDAGVTTYQRLPFMISNDTENIRIDYSLENGVFSIMVFNSSTTGQTLSADRFQNCQFRLVMVSAYDYQTLQVDWNDYLAVESALNQLREPADVE